MRQAPAGIKRRTLILTGVSALLARRTYAASGGIEVIHPWVRYTHELETSAYFTLLNHTEEDDLLTGASCPIAERCTFQDVKWKGLNMSLVDKPNIKIKAMSRLEFTPKSLRVTLKFTKAMDRADGLPITLTFAKAGQVEFKAEVSERMLGPLR